MNGIRKITFSLIAVAITTGYLWHTNRVVTPKTATWNDVLNEAEQGGYRAIDTDQFLVRMAEIK